MAGGLTCRFCQRPLDHIFVDLGMSPLSNAYLHQDALGEMEPFYPLTVYVCSECFLVQLPQVQTPENIFSDYAYFSSWSTSWLEHAKRYAATAVQRFSLGPASKVVEVASNDGYLLQYFREAGVPALGIEPAANVAARAQQRGLETVVDFFGERLATTLAEQRGNADLVIGNNVVAHVPDLNDFVAGLRIMLKAEGTVTLEFPHLMRLIDECQFDTIYHEHFSYLSLLTLEKVVGAHRLRIVDVEEIPTHGGSLRVFIRHDSAVGSRPSERVHALRDVELGKGLDTLAAYTAFDDRVRKVKRDLLRFLIEARDAGQRVIGYGAPAKGNTLLNYCGIRTDLLECTVDRSTDKQGRFLPGTHIPILSPDLVRTLRPDYLLVLPWNLKNEIIDSMSFIREWGGKFVFAIPAVHVAE